MADDAIFDASVKKKKKKVKKVVDLDATPDVEETAKSEEVVEENSVKETQETQEKENDDDDMNLDDFSAMKKKRKKKTKKRVEDETGKTEGENDENANKEGQERELEDGINNCKLSENENVSEGTDYEDREYTYDELLTRVFDVMRAKNPDAVAGEKKKFVMRPPQVVKVGTKKTSFVNFSDISKLLHRQPKHLLAFILAELGTSGSIDGNNQLVIKGRFQQKQIESVLRRYIKEYVTCHTCRSPETLLQKETRLYFLQCEVCGSRCSVASIKSGFQAITGRRALLKNKQT